MKVTSIRTSPEDRRLVAALMKKMGGSLTSVTRNAWRVLAEKERITA